MNTRSDRTYSDPPFHGPATLLAAAALLAAALGPPAGPALAQERPAPDAGSPDAASAFLAEGQLEVSVLVGALTPVTRLTEDRETFSTELTSSGLFGADATYWLQHQLGLGVRAAYAPATVGVVPGSIAGAVPEDLGPADYWALSAEARFRFPPPGEGLSLVPYLSAGGGLRLLDVRSLAGPEVEDSTDPLATLAAGVGLPLSGPVKLRLEIRDHLTFYETPSGESRLQHEPAVMIGGRLGLR